MNLLVVAVCIAFCFVRCGGCNYTLGIWRLACFRAHAGVEQNLQWNERVHAFPCTLQEPVEGL